jgi:ATP synthase protein I
VPPADLGARPPLRATIQLKPGAAHAARRFAITQPALPPVMALPSRRIKQYLRFSAVGLELGLSVIVGLVIGQWLDNRFGTAPWLLLLFLVFGMVAGFRSVYRLLRDLNEQSRPGGKEPRP